MENKADFYQLVGMAIRRVRQERNLSQEQLSQMIDLKRSSLAQIELGTQAISLYHVFLLGKALEIPIGTLVDSFAIGNGAFDHQTTLRFNLDERERILQEITVDDKEGDV